MTVSEKHIAAAIDLVDSEMFKGLMAVDRIGKCAEMVAEALAAAEREGMRRAAEICDEIGDREDVLAISAGSDDLTPLYRRGERAAKECSHMILSEIGEA